jgi:hypothetical protein
MLSPVGGGLGGVALSRLLCNFGRNPRSAISMLFRSKRQGKRRRRTKETFPAKELLEMTKSRAVATAYFVSCKARLGGYRRTIPKTNAPDKMLFSTIPPVD